MLMPAPRAPEIVPLLLMVPPMLLLLTAMPVRVDVAPPVVVMTPVAALVTLPATAMPFKLMQSIEPELLTELWSVTGAMAHVPANATGAPPAISRAATDDDANRCSDRRAMLARTKPKASVGMKAFEEVTEQALNGEND
jgi:hypothetical protein